MEKMRVKQRPLNPNGKTVFLQSAVRSVFCNICHYILTPCRPCELENSFDPFPGMMMYKADS